MSTASRSKRQHATKLSEPSQLPLIYSDPLVNLPTIVSGNTCRSLYKIHYASTKKTPWLYNWISLANRPGSMNNLMKDRFRLHLEHYQNNP